LVNGYDECTIKTSRVQRKITAIQTMPSGAYYQCAIGTSSTGKQMLQWYPEAMVSMQAKAPISPALPKAACVAIMLRLIIE